jgi:pSer/pThr/pTyr-binding forkhead associated (FHA) protein
MPAQLVALTEGPSILLDKPILLIGRHPECDIQIESRKISRRHCCVAQVNDYLTVRDLGSTNGIAINGVRVLEGRLAAGDELTIGNYRYRVTFESQAQPGPAPARPRGHLPQPPVGQRGCR